MAAQNRMREQKKADWAAQNRDRSDSSQPEREAGVASVAKRESYGASPARVGDAQSS
jgi:hypothetical protein